MRTIDEMSRDATQAFRELLEEAFEAGREVGVRSAAREMKERLAQFVGAFEVDGEPSSGAQPARTEYRASAAEVDVQAAALRLSPGTVKPAIEKLIAASIFGITTADIIATTKFKPSSVRGTLWTLQSEGVIQRDGEFWLASEHAGQPAGPSAPQKEPPSAEEVFGHVNLVPHPK